MICQGQPRLMSAVSLREFSTAPRGGWAGSEIARLIKGRGCRGPPSGYNFVRFGASFFANMPTAVLTIFRFAPCTDEK